MATIDWPATLPQNISTDGYGQAAADNALRTSMEIGPAKVRRRTSAAPRPVSATIIVTEAQLVIFKAFHADDILDGSLRFNWLDPDDGTTAVEMRFTEPPSWSYEGGGLYNIAMALEILP